MMMNRKELAGQRKVLEETHEFEVQQARDKAQPIFSFAGASGKRHQQTLEFKNDGARVTQLEVRALSGRAGLWGASRAEVLSQGSGGEIELEWAEGKNPGTAFLEFKFVDANGETGIQLYEHEPLGYIQLRRFHNDSNR